MECYQRRRQRERQKRNKFRLVKQQLCTVITPFCTFICRHCTTTTWKCLISRFIVDVNKLRRILLSLSKLECSPLVINSREIRWHLTFSVNWNKRDKYFKTRTFTFFASVAVVDAKAPLLSIAKRRHKNEFAFRQYNRSLKMWNVCELSWSSILDDRTQVKKVKDKFFVCLHPP